LRRCAVLNLRPDEASPQHFVDWLQARASVHAPFAEWASTADSPLQRAALQVWDDRDRASKQGLATVGLAEYLDLLYSLHRLSGNDIARANELLDQLSPFALVKHREQDQLRPAVKHAAAVQQIAADG
jgi:hypothetical protein